MGGNMMKLLKKYLAILLLTAVFAVAGLHLASRVLTPKGEIEKFYDEPRNSIDVLVVGSSHSMSGISPVHLYEQTGLTAYNLSTWSQPVWVSYHYILEALKYQQPQVVVVDVFGAFYDKSYLSGVDVDLVSDDFAASIRPSWNLLRLNLARRSAQVTRKTWDEYLNITKYHSRMDRLEWEDVAVLFRDDSSTGKGYGPMYVTESFADYVPAVTDARAELYAPAAVYLQKIIDLSREKGFALVLTKVPYITEERDIALLNTVQDICDAQGIPFVDLCRENGAGLDYTADMADHGHVNYRGAQKVTAALGGYLAEMELVPQHAQNVEEAWQQALATELDSLTVMDIRVTAPAGEKLAKAAAHGSTAMVVLRQGELTAEQQQTLQTLLEGTVLEPCAQLAPGSCAVYDGTQLLLGDPAQQWLAQHAMQVQADETGAPVLQYRGQSYSHRLTGVNLLLTDTRTGDIYQSVSYGAETDFTAYTG